MDKINKTLPIKVTLTDSYPKTICFACLEKLELIDNFLKLVAAADVYFINTKISSVDHELPIKDSKNKEFCYKERISKSPNLRNEIRCRICNANFQTRRKCFLHSAMHSLSLYFPCGLCEFYSKTLDEWRKHYINRHNGRQWERRAANHECSICKKKFITTNRLNFHFQFHESENMERYCKKCDKFFSSESVLYYHSLMVHDQCKDFCCDTCGSQFRSLSQLHTHQRKHKDDRPYECEICSKQFHSADNFRRHQKIHLPNKPFQCSQCNKTFNRTNSLNKHLLIHQVVERRPMICQICNICNQVLLNYPSSTESHIHNCSKSTPITIQDKQLDVIYRCEYCQQCYATIASAKSHSKVHTGPLPYVCTICQVTFPTYNQITVHRKSHKRITDHRLPNDDSIIKFFFCNNCEKTFVHYTNMNLHRKACVISKLITCPTCHDVFYNKQEFTKHKRRREINTKLICQTCQISFNNKCSFENHNTIVHTGNKPMFTCSYCEKAFQQKARLTSHIRSHTGEKPFSCEYCKKEFSYKADRDNHQMIHSGERRFKCELCEKAFMNSARLREHMMHHSNNRPYKCDYCDQTFKKTNARKIHTFIHTGEKPYQCDICGISFRRTGDLNKHKKTRHKVVK